MKRRLSPKQGRKLRALFLQRDEILSQWRAAKAGPRGSARGPFNELVVVETAITSAMRG